MMSTMLYLPDVVGVEHAGLGGADRPDHRALRERGAVVGGREVVLPELENAVLATRQDAAHVGVGAEDISRERGHRKDRALVGLKT